MDCLEDFDHIKEGALPRNGDHPKIGDQHRDGDHPSDGGRLREFYHPKGWFTQFWVHIVLGFHQKSDDYIAKC